MKKFIKLVLLGLIICCLNGCETYAQIYDNDNVEISYYTITTYGTPIYYNGIISYYIYRGGYYYPYRWNNNWYFYRYHHVQPRGFIYHPERYHRPNMRRGDVHHRHSYGPSHKDQYRGYGHSNRYDNHINHHNYNNSHNRSNNHGRRK